MVNWDSSRVGIDRYKHLNRDVDEAKDWIMEKDEILSTEDVGKDLRGVQGLQRKHEGLERDLAALENKISQLGENAMWHACGCACACMGM